MLVECYDERGAEVYEIIIKQIFQDLVLGAAVDDLRAYVNPDDPVFVLAIKMKKTSSVVTFEDVANLSYVKEDDITRIIVDNEKIRKINKEYRNIDKETDVISFALEDDETFINIPVRILGDIYISIDKAKLQAEEYGHSLKRELAFLTVHGMLHLLGYDHMIKEDEVVMFKKQDEILNELEITR